MPHETALAADTSRLITLTDAAVAKATDLLDREEPGLALRVAVEAGGCSGLRYQLYFTDEYKRLIAWELALREDEGFFEPEAEDVASQRALLARNRDTLTWHGRVPVLVHATSSPYLPGATLDFLDTLRKSGFTIDNPHAAGSCACGDSFG